MDRHRIHDTEPWLVYPTPLALPKEGVNSVDIDAIPPSHDSGQCNSQLQPHCIFLDEPTLRSIVIEELLLPQHLCRAGVDMISQCSQRTDNSPVMR
jgi:hypothetical protein